MPKVEKQLQAPAFILELLADLDEAVGQDYHSALCPIAVAHDDNSPLIFEALDA